MNEKPYRSEELQAFFHFNKDDIESVDREKYKAAFKFIETFQAIENTFSFIIDFTSMQYLYVSNSCEQVTGYSKNVWLDGGVEFAMSIYHPEDEIVAKEIHQEKIKHMYSVPINKRMNFKYSHDFRVQHADGYFIRLLHHAFYLDLDKEGNPTSCLCIMSDISRIKTNNNPQLEISEIKGEQLFKPIIQKSYCLPKTVNLSTREKEVLQLIANGKSNIEIAEELNISEHTVADHRKNMLRRNKIKSIPQLLTLACKQEII